MGCDIHAYIEHVVPGYMSTCFAELHMNRNYDLFNLLAGVRASRLKVEGPIYETRGVPTELSWQANAHWNDGIEDWHSASWLNSKEASTIQNIIHDKEWGVVVAILNTLGDGSLSASRIVFWFDN